MVLDVFDNNTSAYEVLWSFNKAKTIELNENSTNANVKVKMNTLKEQNYSYFDLNPFNNNPRNKTVLFKPNYFFENFFYVFDVSIIGSPKFFFLNQTISKQFTIEMETTPKCREFSVIPNKGLDLTTNFLIRCFDCYDDTSTPDQLEKTVYINYLNRLDISLLNATEILDKDKFGYKGNGLYNSTQKILFKGQEKEIVTKLKGEVDAEVTYFNISCSIKDAAGLESQQSIIVDVYQNNVDNNIKAIKSVNYKKHFHSEESANGEKTFFFLRDGVSQNDTSNITDYYNDFRVTSGKYPIGYNLTFFEDDSIYKLSQVLYSLTTNSDVKESSLNLIVPNSKNRTTFKSLKEFVIIEDVQCSNSYCNNKGRCEIVNYYITCICDEGYIGSYCHLDSESSEISKYLLFQLYDKSLEFNNVHNNTMFNNTFFAIRNIIQSSSYVLTNGDFLFYNKAMMSVSTAINFGSSYGYASRTFLNTYFGLIDYIISNGLNNVLPLMYQNTISKRNLKQIGDKDSHSFGEIENIDRLTRNLQFDGVIETGTRNSTLSQENQEIFIENFKIFKKELDTIITAIVSNYKKTNQGRGVYTYRSYQNSTIILENEKILISTPKSNSTAFKGITNRKIYDNLEIHITKLTKSFNFVKYFEENIKNYKPYFNAESCIKSYKGDVTRLIFVFIIYNNNPYISSISTNENRVSKMIRLDIYNIDNLEKVTMKVCPGFNSNYNPVGFDSTVTGVRSSSVNTTSNLEEKNHIKLYFPVEHLYLPTTINHWRSLMEPSKQLNETSKELTEPVVTNSTGNVLDVVFKDRLEKLYIPVNFTCNHFNPLNYSVSNVDMKYSNFTVENYFLCNDYSNENSEYFVNFYYTSKNLKFRSRFMFFEKFEIYKLKSNWINNGFFYYIGFLGLTVMMLIIHMFTRSTGIKGMSLLSIKRDIVLEKTLPFLKDYKVFDPKANSEFQFEQNVDLRDVGKAHSKEINIKIDNGKTNTIESTARLENVKINMNKIRLENKEDEILKLSKGHSSSKNNNNDMSKMTYNSNDIIFENSIKKELSNFNKETLNKQHMMSYKIVNKKLHMEDAPSENVLLTENSFREISKEDNDVKFKFIENVKNVGVPVNNNNNDDYNIVVIDQNNGEFRTFRNDFFDDLSPNERNSNNHVMNNFMADEKKNDFKEKISKEENPFEKAVLDPTLGQLFVKDKNIYPSLKKDPSYEDVNEEILKYNDLTACGFLKRGIWKRHFFLSTFIHPPYFYGRSAKVLLFVSYYGIVGLVVAFFLVASENYYFVSLFLF